ncbi:Abi family protein [Fusobacterium sp.]|uniref:Abi family protein n=1 Tax=Fusobacterium sp. TaxID=68766 RepID=UPI00260248E2|nr:Abi family protein [Fusobacterium sp.]
MIYDKPFLNYEEQLEKLKNTYNLKSYNHENDIMLLKTISYYDLVNGYKDCFMENNKFVGDITLADIFFFNNTDKRFQNILFLYSVYIENIFKTKMAHLIGQTRGVEFSQYLDINKYHSSNPKRNKKLEETIKNMIFAHNSSQDSPTKYYRENHNHIPPWILFKNTKFTTIIDLFSFLKKDEKLAIISEYSYFSTPKLSDDKKIELFKNMITVVRKFRNKIAHNYKIIGVNLEKTKLNLRDISYISPYKFLSSYDIRNRRGENDLYAMIISLFFLLEPLLLKLLFATELKGFSVTEKSDVYFKMYNFPNNFKENIENIYSTLTEELKDNPSTNK